MISIIYIENFKCFKKFTLDLGQLTLLTGYNGAGKSTSIQPLLLLSQVLREPPSSTALPLNGYLTRLGSAGDITSSESGGKLYLKISASDEINAVWVFEPKRELGRHEMKLCHSYFSFEKTDAPCWLPSHSKDNFLEQLREVIFLSAVRDPFGEAQPFPDNPSLVVGDVGVDGRFASYWFVRQADEEVPIERRHPEDARITVRAQIDAWLNELFPSGRVNAEEIEGLALAKTSFRIGRSSDWHRPANVGYGLSYAFPILVALVCAKPGQIFIVDSPEAHLHPRAQSTMGRILARFAAAGIQIIIESHSDHLLSGIRLAVRENMLSSKDVAIHFFNDCKISDEECSRIEITEDGGVAEWPVGFFDQAINDLIELS